MNIHSVKLDFCIDDNPAPLRAMLERLDGIMADTSQATSWEVDLSKCHYLGPNAVAVLAVLVLTARARNQQYRLLLPRSPAELSAYCHFSGLEYLVDPATGPPRPDNVFNETVPLQQFQQATVTAHDPIARLVKRHVDPVENFGFVLGTCLSEVMQNVQDHSGSRVGGVACARYFSSKNEVRIAVADQGVGIANSIRAVYPHISTTVDALRAVIRGGFSAQSRPNNLGLGISNLSGMVCQFGGRMAIVTGNIIASMGFRGTWSFQNIRAKFEGTGVFFTLPVT